MAGQQEGEEADVLRGFEKPMHVAFSRHMANVLPDPYRGQDASRMTLVYFVVGAQLMLGEDAAVQKMAPELIDWVYTNQVLPLPPAAQEQAGEGRDGADDRDDLFSQVPLAHCGFRGGPAFGSPWNPSCDPAVVAEWQQKAVAAKAPEKSSSSLDGGDRGLAARIRGLGALDADHSHMAMTYTALAVLRMCGDDLRRVDTKSVTAAMRELQLPDGSFCPVAGTENDMRFVYCAAVISHLLGDWSGMDRDAATRYILGAQSYDGGIGQGLGQESHGGSTYCAVAALTLMGRLDELPRREQLIHWCLMRQSLGFQGRINKPSDCCYSFWIGATLAMLGKYELVDFEMVRGHTLACQQKTGGLGKSPEAYPDVLHTYMGFCGLSLGGEASLGSIDPALGFRIDIARKCNAEGNPYQVE